MARLARTLAPALLALVLLVLSACSSPADTGRASRSGGDASGAPTLTADPTPSAEATGVPVPRRRDRTADAVIDRAGRPAAGAVSEDGHTLLLYLHDPSSWRAREQSAAFRVIGPENVASGVLALRSGYWDRPRVTPHSGGFVVTVSSDRRAWAVSTAGEVRRLRLDDRPSALEEEDVLVESASVRSTGSGHVSDQPAWVFRPEGGAVLTRVARPRGAHLVHADGEGRVWALGEPESGRALLFSALPGEEWEKHDIGAYSDTFHGCVCDTRPGPHGRGGVLVLAGGSVSHVSTDHGRTWESHDLEDTVPYRRVLARDRYPSVSALADGRLVVGYSTVGYWVGRDDTNRSFERASRPAEVTWAAGLSDGLLFDGGRASADGGRTWVLHRP